MHLLTEKEAMETFKLKRHMLYTLRERGMPIVRLGEKLVRYDKVAIEQWIREQNKGGKDE